MVHSGSAQGGHYTALLRAHHTDPFHEFNDATVSAADDTRLCAAEGIGAVPSPSETGTNAYLLIYRRRATLAQSEGEGGIGGVVGGSAKGGGAKADGAKSGGGKGGGAEGRDGREDDGSVPVPPAELARAIEEEEADAARLQEWQRLSDSLVELTLMPARDLRAESNLTVLRDTGLAQVAAFLNRLNLPPPTPPAPPPPHTHTTKARTKSGLSHVRGRLNLLSGQVTQLAVSTVADAVSADVGVVGASPTQQVRLRLWPFVSGGSRATDGTVSDAHSLEELGVRG